ncbi:MAG: cytochrome C [Polyangiaceae bacterium]|nr:cytochrome C [Polyangiaceae bacterium]
MLVATAVMALLTVWSIAVDAPLEEPANPTKTPNPSKAPWYFLGLQELLVYFDPWFAGVVLPGMIIVGLMVIPYLDVNPKGNGYYCFRDRRFAVSTFLFGFLGLWISAILVGTFARGPGWNLYAPGQYWDAHKVVAITSRDLPPLIGVSDPVAGMIVGAVVVFGFLFGIPWLFWRLRRDKSPGLRQLGAVRYAVTAFFFMSMLGVVVKIGLRLGFDVKYVLATPWLNL